MNLYDATIYIYAGCFLGGVAFGIAWTAIMFKLDEKKRIEEKETFYSKSQKYKKEKNQ